MLIISHLLINTCMHPSPSLTKNTTMALFFWDILLPLSFIPLFLLLQTLLPLYFSARRLPIRFPLLGHTPYILLNFRRLHDFLTQTLTNSSCTFVLHGPIGTEFDFLLTSDPANANHVFNANFSNYPKGAHFADLFDFLGCGIFNSDDHSWKFQRKLAHSFMSAPKFRTFVMESTSTKVENNLLPLLSNFADDNNKQEKVLDLQDVFMRLTFDTTCKLVYGIDPGYLSPGFPTVEFAVAMDAAEEVAFFRHAVPTTWWKVLRWMKLGPERKMVEAVKVINKSIDYYVSRRKEERKSGSDLLTSYLDSHADISKAGFADLDKFLRDTTLNLMVAGRDTMSSALTWFFYMISKHPEVESKIVEEIKVVRGRNHVDIVSNLRNLVYLHAALCESLRLYPPVPFEHKGAVKADRLPSGAHVDEYTMVMFSLYSMGRMEDVWGKDCMDFRPERWISPDTGRVGHVPSYKFLAFNAGPRTCLGKEIALTQLKVVAAAVIERFRVRVVEGFVAKPKLSIILHMEGGLKVRVSKREDY